MDLHGFETDLLHKLQDTRRLALIGIGADLREDDAVGTLLARELIDEIDQGCHLPPGIDHEHSIDELVKVGGLLVINATVAPEQYITLVKEFAPDTVLLVDAAAMGKGVMPGDIAFIKETELDASTFSTHTISLRYFIEILQTMGLRATFLIIGIQPGKLGYGEEISPHVAETKVFLKSMLLRYVRKTFMQT
ncbi:MAG: hydrogenase maturation protease [Candidatus Lokiarchaeota archaeon]|nr:hydrogenase maturation protease [Candidatus Lokiarchaeota archaeon]